MTWTSRYKANELPEVRIARILPNISEQELFTACRCYVGISLENPIFEAESLAAILFWATERFEHCMVIVGDFLCRYNEEILAGVGNSAAGVNAGQLGETFIERTRDLFAELPADKIVLNRWRDHLQSREFKQARTILRNLFEKEPAFAAAVEKDAYSFVKRIKKRGAQLAVSTEQAIELSCQYILEETAVFSALSEQGWRVELYPGSELHVLTEIAKGNFIHAPDGLKQRINVELKVG